MACARRRWAVSRKPPLRSVRLTLGRYQEDLSTAEVFSEPMAGEAQCAECHGVLSMSGLDRPSAERRSGTPRWTVALRAARMASSFWAAPSQPAKQGAQVLLGALAGDA
jgi:hypothetical protein